MPKTSTSPAAPIPPHGQPTVTSPDRQNAKTLSGLRRFGGPWLWLAIAAPLLGGVLLVVQAWTLAGIVGGVVENGAVIAAMTPGIVLIFGLLLTRAALTLLVLLYSSLALARLGGLWLDGGAQQTFNLYALLLEVVSMVLCFWALRGLPRH